MTQENKNVSMPANEPIKFKGKFIKAIGRRKSSVAQIRLYKNGNGIIVVNGQKINKYFVSDRITIVTQPLKQAGLLRELNFSIVVRGGGTIGQAEAIRHGITRSLIEIDENLKPALKSKGWPTRDARRKERKKPGLKKARRAPQWSKR